MALFVYITAPDTAVAEQLADMLVSRKLAAGVNLLPGMRSVYWWKGSVEHAAEVVLIAKTATDRYPDLEQAVRAAHPYECPCIVALPVTHANPAYAEWIESSTRME